MLKSCEMYGEVVKMFMMQENISLTAREVVSSMVHDKQTSRRHTVEEKV